MARDKIPYRRSDPKKLAEDAAEIRRDFQRRAQEAKETNTYAPISPPEQGVKAPRRRGRRITNVGIVTGFRRNNSPV